MNEVANYYGISSTDLNFVFCGFYKDVYDCKLWGFLMPTLDLNEVSLNYQIWGDIRHDNGVVTLINGYTRSLSDFRGMAKAFEKSGLALISFDNRGAGLTQSALDFSLEEIVSDVLQLWDHLGVVHSMVLGISMGGLIAQLLLKRATSRVDKLVLISTSPDPAYIDKSESPWAPDLPAIELKLSRNFSTSFLERNRLLVRAMAKNVLESMTTDNFIARAKAQRRAIDALAPGAFDFHSGVETLVLHGTDDAIIPARVVETFQQKFVNSKVKLFEGRGHLLIAECPSELYAAVKDFCTVEGSAVRK